MKRVLATGLVVTATWATSVSAQQNTAADDAALRSELEALRNRVEQLEGAGPSQADADTASRISISGDFRFRHEYIDDADAATDRNRQRIRSRLNIGADLGDDLEVGFTLATGATDPVSANQTLGDSFTRKDIGLDRAFFRWNVSDDVTLEGGKIGVPWFRPGGFHLLYDSDVNPEGLFLGYDGDHFFANIGGFWINERGGSDQDSILYSLQGGYKAMIGDAEVTFGGSYFNYDNVQGFLPLWEGSPEGNTVDLAGNLVNDYDLAEVFAQADLDVGKHPLRLFFDYVENTAADTLNTGYAVGVRWRRASAPGTWDVTWAYEDLEADAVIGTYTDSDFGSGGTDGKGHELKATYVLRDNVRLGGTLFINEIDEALNNKHDYTRLQLDINFLF